jgi:hypothetical protein
MFGLELKCSFQLNITITYALVKLADRGIKPVSLYWKIETVRRSAVL